MVDVDIAVIGGGVVGCATAAVLAARGDSVALLERETRLGAGTTSRNSGVIHSGLYYDPGSLKAVTCVRGQALLYEWAARHDVPHRKTGKLVVAFNAAQGGALTTLHERAQANGSRVEWVTPQRAAALEPLLPPVQSALWCPETGIVDPHALTQSLANAAEAAGALVALQASVQSVEVVAGGYQLRTTRGPIGCARVINAAGLWAPEVAHWLGQEPPPQYPCRGDYYRLSRRLPYQRLLYPVKDPASPGLGVHLTLELDGGLRLGPDTRWVERIDDVAPHLEPELSSQRQRFAEAARRLLQRDDLGELSWDGCGIRPKLRAPNETSERDFLIVRQSDDCVHLFGIESPGLTASLTLAEHVAAMV